MLTGLRHAAQQGYSHALQIDADGQHRIADIPRFLEQAVAHPRALIVGCPEYDSTVPVLRLWARYLTHVWVSINTLSRQIKDSMCGFRVYPLESVGGARSARQVWASGWISIPKCWSGCIGTAWRLSMCPRRSFIQQTAFRIFAAGSTTRCSRVCTQAVFRHVAAIAGVDRAQMEHSMSQLLPVAAAGIGRRSMNSASSPACACYFGSFAFSDVGRSGPRFIRSCSGI